MNRMIIASRQCRIMLKKSEIVNLHFQDLRESSVKTNNMTELNGTPVAECNLRDRM